MVSNCGAGEDSWKSLGLQGDPTSPFRKSVPNIHWKDWCWSWSSSTLATWCEELTHWKSVWCWERLRAWGEGGIEDKMVGWHHQFNGREFEQTLGDGEGQGSLACCDPCGHKESDTTYQLNNTTNYEIIKEKVVPILYNIFQKSKRKKFIYGVSITLIPKSDKDCIHIFKSKRLQINMSQALRCKNLWQIQSKFGVV